MEQTLLLNYHNLLIFVGLDSYTPQKDVICVQDTYPILNMNAKNLTSAKQECSANTKCAKFTDLCGDGDDFIWCRAGDVRHTSTCNSVVYLKNNYTNKRIT